MRAAHNMSICAGRRRLGHLPVGRFRMWRIGFAGAAILALSVLCSPQNAVPPPNAPAHASGPYRIAGKVVNASTGEPVRRATVAALGEDDGQIVQSMETNAEGSFALE